MTTWIENLKDVSAASISRMIPAIRFFLKFVTEKNYVNKDLSNFLPTAHYQKNGNIPYPTYTGTERFVKCFFRFIDVFFEKSFQNTAKPAVCQGGAVEIFSPHTSEKILPTTLTMGRMI